MVTIFDEKKAAAWLAREQKQAMAWLTRFEQRGSLPVQHKVLADYAAGKANVGVGTVALDQLAAYHATLGYKKVFAGDDSGFLDIDLACVMNYWVIRLLTRGYELDQRPGKVHRVLMDRVATCWMHAEAIGTTAIRPWLDALIQKLVAGEPCVGGKDMNPLCTLVAHLATGTDVAVLERSGWAQIGVYASVASRTLTAADYHTLAMFHQNGVDGAGFPPFHADPYRMVPFELQAIARRTGIPLAGRHPLITSPLARVRHVPEVATTAELRAVAASGAPEVTAG